jgi:hypothetical protein
MLSHTVMRTALLGILGLLAMTSVVGCGPGLTRHSQKAKSPDVFTTMDAELENSIPGTTTLTSAEPMPLPGSRLSLAQWEDDDAPLPQVTWGLPAFPPELATSPYAVDQSKPDPLAYP